MIEINKRKTMKPFKHIFIVFILLSISCKTNSSKEKITKENNKEISQKLTVSDTLSNRNEVVFFKRNTNEKAIDFINRIYDDKIDLNHPIIETDKWIKDTNTIFVFENNKLDDDLGFDVNGYIYLSKNKIDYKKYIIDTYSPEGRSANIETVFFTNADNDINKELIIICSWEQMIKGMIEGKIYETFVYDDLVKNRKLIKLENISNHFGFEFDGVQEGVVKKAKYKKSGDIKKELKSLGFK